MRLRLALYACYIMAVGLLVFITIFALLTPRKTKSNSNDDKNDKPSSTSTGTGTGDCGCSAPENPQQPPPLMTPFVQIVARSQGTFPTDAAGWKRLWTSGVLAHISNDRPRVEFYFSHYCPACLRFKPIWEESFNWFPSRLQRVMVDCGEECNRPLCDVVQRIPTIIFRRNADDMGIAFTGARTKDSLYDFTSLLWSAYERDLESGKC